MFRTEYAQNIFRRAKAGGALSDEKKTNLAYQVGNSIIFSKRNPQRPVK